MSPNGPEVSEGSQYEVEASSLEEAKQAALDEFYEEFDRGMISYCSDYDGSDLDPRSVELEAAYVSGPLDINQPNPGEPDPSAKGLEVIAKEHGYSSAEEMIDGEFAKQQKIMSTEEGRKIWRELEDKKQAECRARRLKYEAKKSRDHEA